MAPRVPLLVATVVASLLSLPPRAAAMVVFNPDCEGLPRVAPLNVTCALQCVNLTMADALRFYAYGCADASVAVDPWLPHALHTQMVVAARTPLRYVTFPATHNSLVSRINSFGMSDFQLTKLLTELHLLNTTVLENQQLGLTDQLRMGVRHLEFDTSWDNETGLFRVCDARTSNYIIPLLEVLAGHALPLEPGCGEWCHPFPELLREFRAFYDQSDRDVFIVMLDTPDYDNHAAEVTREIVQALGDVVYTPLDLLADFGPDARHLPTMEFLARRGKRVLVTEGSNYGSPYNQTVFYKYGPFWEHWAEFSPDDFHPENCTLQPRGRPDPVYPGAGNITRVIDGSIMVGPFFSERKDGMVTPESLRQMTECGVSYVSLDQVNPVELESTVWSWAPEHPPSPCRYRNPDAAQCAAQKLCAALDGPTGRWLSLRCDEQLPSACRSAATGSWATTGNATAWESAPRCAEGYAFVAPDSAPANYQLRKAVGTDRAWLGLQWNATLLDWSLL